MAIVAPLTAGLILRTLWDDFGELSVRLRSQSIIALSIAVLFEIVGSLPEISDNRLLSEAVNLTSTIGILPFEIAVFRLLILNEATPGYDFAISTVRFQRMLGWTVALWLLASIPTYLADMIAPSEAAGAVFSGIAIVIAIAVMLRLTILLPAIAVDAPGASAVNAVADTRGHAWLILKAYLVILLPILLLIIAAALLAWLGGLSDVSGRSAAGNAALSALVGILGYLTAVAVAIIAARLFMSLGDRVKGNPPGTSLARTDD